MRSEVFSIETSGNWEVEAHSATLPLLIQLLKEHPDKEKEIMKLYKSVKENIGKNLKKAKDKTRALEDLVKAKKEIAKEIAKETNELEVKINQLKEEIKELKQKIQTMTGTGIPDDIAKSLDKVEPDLEPLECKLDNLTKKLKELDKKNQNLLSDFDDFINKKKKRKENEQKIVELKKELENPPPTADRDWYVAKRKEIKELEDENKKLSDEIPKLRRSIKNQMRQELEDIKEIDKLIDSRRGILKDIEKLQKKINKLLQKLDEGQTQELREELEMLSDKLSELSTELMIIDFKIETLKDLESIIENKFNTRGYW
jgi:chromosome segregation ATPase